jgi:hypothetical protein
MSYGFLKEASTCRIEAALNVGIESPWASALAVHARVEGRHGLPRASPWSEALGVGLKAAFPCGFQGQFDERLHHALLLRRDASRSLAPATFWYVAPFDRLGAVPVQAETILPPRQALLGGIAHDPRRCLGSACRYALGSPGGSP